MNRPMRLLLIAQSQNLTSPALELAVDMARLSGAALKVVSFVHLEATDSVGKAEHEGRDRARAEIVDAHRLWLQGALAVLHREGLEVRYEISWGYANAQELAVIIERYAADLVIKDLQADSAIKRMVLSSLDWELLGASTASILYVKKEFEGRQLKFIAAVEFAGGPVADQAPCDRIVDVARNLALAHGAALHIMSVYDRNELGGGLLNDVLNLYPIPSYEAQKQIFDTYAQCHDIEHQHRHFVVGNAASAIADYIDRSGYDLLIMATRSTGSENEPPGRTAKQLLTHPPCNLLVVKPASVNSQ